MDNPVNVEDLLEKYYAGKCTPDEEAVVRQYIADPANDQQLGVFMQKKWDLLIAQEQASPAIIPQKNRYHEIKARIWPEQKRSIPVWRIAASILVILTAGSIYINRIPLLDFFYPVKIVHVSTKPGEQLDLTLPDGSKVWLNTASSLSYPEKFRGATRNINLTGEAFFQVKPNPEKPFFVHAGAFYARVLGTSFNVKAYPEQGEDIHVTVNEGKVAVGIENETNARNEFATLTRNHRVMFDPQTNVLFRDSVASEQTMAWRDGTLSFHQTSLKDIASTLSRWFAVKIDVSQSEKTQCYFSATYYKGVQLRDILEAMRITGKIDYDIRDSKIEIHAKNNCKPE